MKVRNPLALLILIIITSFYLFGSPLKNCLAEKSELIFEKNTHYDVYYQVDNKILYITNVKIIDTVIIGEATFLEVVSSSLPMDQPGYISFASIISILPVGSSRLQIIK